MAETESDSEARAWFDGQLRLHAGLFLAEARRRMNGDRSEAEDVFQQASLKAWKGLRSLRDRTRFAAWLLVIIRNEAARAIERRVRERAAEEELRRRAEPEVESFEEASGSLESFRRSLPAACAEVLWLKVSEDLRNKEIAVRLDKTEWNVARLLRDARLRIVRSLVGRLPPPQDTIVELWFRRGETIAGVAEQLGLSDDEVARHLQRARHKMMKLPVIRSLVDQGPSS